MLQFKIAEHTNDLLDAWSLVYEQYRKLKLIPANPQKIWAFPDYFCKDSVTLLCYRDRELLGTISAIWAKRIPLDTYYPDELNELRAKGNRLVECGLLGKKEASLKSHEGYLMQKVLLEFVRQIKLDCALVGLHPRATKLYEERFGFRVMGPDKVYTTLNDAPVRPIVFNIADVPVLVPNKDFILPNFSKRLRITPKVIAQSPKLKAFEAWLRASKFASTSNVSTNIT